MVVSDDVFFYSMWLKILPALAVGEFSLHIPSKHTHTLLFIRTLQQQKFTLTWNCFIGNAVIVVPGVKMAPPTLLLAQLLMEAGLPAGVLNVVTGSGSVRVRVAQNSQIGYVTYSGNKQVWGVARACHQT